MSYGKFFLLGQVYKLRECSREYSHIMYVCVYASVCVVGSSGRIWHLVRWWTVIGHRPFTAAWPVLWAETRSDRLYVLLRHALSRRSVLQKSLVRFHQIWNLFSPDHPFCFYVSAGNHWSRVILLFRRHIIENPKCKRHLGT